MSHALERTSPKGQAFLGRCTKCGATGLGTAAALQPCPADGVVSDEAALVAAIDPPSGGSKPHS